MSRAVPKFASFKPKAIQAISEPSNIPKNPAESREHHARHVCNPVRRQKSGSRPDRQDHDRSLQHGLTISHGQPSRPETDRDSNDICVIDRQGDRKNLTYGSLHKYDVPSYHRSGSGVVLGLPRSSRINREMSSTSALVIDSMTTANVFDDVSRKGYDQRLATKGAKRLIRPTEHDPLAHGPDYVPLVTRQKRRRVELPQESLVAEVRMLEHKVTRSDEESDSDLTSETSDTEIGPAARMRVSELNYKLRHHPEDHDSWHELIALQAEIVFPGIDEATYTASQRKTVADLRLSLYDKAIMQTHTEPRKHLIRSKLAEGAKIWDPASLRRHWELVLATDEVDLSFWIEYLDTLQADNALTYTEMKGNFLAVLQRLHATNPVRPPGDLAATRMHVFLRMTSFLRCAGYAELAVACWQGILDINLKRDTIPRAQALTTLEESWDAEEPRIGEPYSGDNDEASHIRTTDNKYATFAVREQAVDNMRYLPGKTTDDIPDNDYSVIDDALHVVLFSDMADILRVVVTEVDSCLLLDAFLTFWGLPAMPLAEWNACTSWRRDARLGSSSMPLASVVTTSTIWSSFSSVKLSPKVLSFVKNALQAFQVHIKSSTLKLYIVALLAHHSIPEAYNQVRSMLSADPADLTLYGATAQVEALRARHTKARSIWSSAIAVAQKSSVHAVGLVTLVCDCVGFELSQGDYQLACRSLAHFHGSLRLPVESPVDTVSLPLIFQPSVKLAMGRDLKIGAETCLRKGDAGSSLVYISLAIILSYLTADEPVAAALATVSAQVASINQIVSTTTQNSAQAKVVQEAVHQYVAALITLHIDQRKPYRPATVLTWLDTALTDHPSNSVLLTLWYKIESKITQLDDVVKGISRPWTRLVASTPLSIWYSIISRETGRFRDAEVGARSSHTVRALFRRALLEENSAVRHCTRLWDMWLDFELEVARDTVSRALEPSHKVTGAQMEQIRAVFFAGLKPLPWDKSWILRGLQTFDQDKPWALEEVELKNVYERLFLKEMRVREEIDST